MAALLLALAVAVGVPSPQVEPLQAAGARTRAIATLTHQWAYASVRAPQAWRISAGDPRVVVAVLDSGVDGSHPLLAGTLIPGVDLVNGDDDPADDNGHGTVVASVVARMAPRARIMPVKVLGAEGLGSSTVVAAGIVWAADHGADVINLSLGGPDPSPALEAAVDYAWGRGAVVVAAAGNEGRNELDWPAAAPNTLAVSAVDRLNRRVRYANRGSGLDLVAPSYVLTLDRRGVASEFVGTSAASALVAGAAALLWSAEPTLSRDELVERLTGSALDLGPPGFDESYGAGLLDAAAALGSPRTGVQ